MGTATGLARPGWSGIDRILIVVLLIVWSLGTPGLGIETREPEGSLVLGAVYGIGFLLVLVGVAASWKWPAVAAWSALAGTLGAVVLVLLDLAGVMVGPPPAAMVAVNVGVLIVGAAVTWRSWRLVRA